MVVSKQNIKDIPLADIPALVKDLGLKPFASGQIIQWLYQKDASSFEDMTNLSKDTRKLLDEKFYFSSLKLKTEQISKDGTRKFAWELNDGNVVESVLIPSETYAKAVKFGGYQPNIPEEEWKTRLTLCISTQVGCPMGCLFCRTAAMGFVRNLTQSEIVDQILEAQRIAGQRITNVVLMGMGEPLSNFDNVVNAVRIMTDSKCLGLSKRHVTLSTSGLVPGIERLSKEDLGIKLAISLNATTDKVRSEIMPINKKYPLEKLFEALKKYSKETKRARMTFEYVMIGGLNDTEEDAKRLVKFLSLIPSKVNLIPFNGFEGSKYRSTDENALEKMAKYLRNKNIQVNIRASRGSDILAACGQLASKIKERSKNAG